MNELEPQGAPRAFTGSLAAASSRFRAILPVSPIVVPKIKFAIDSSLEGDGFEPSVPRVMGGDLGRRVPALIAVFELAGTAVALQRGAKVVWPHRHPEFP